MSRHLTTRLAAVVAGAVAFALVIVAAACEARDDASGARSDAATHGADDVVDPIDDAPEDPTVAVADGRITLRGADGVERVVASFADEEGELVHGVVRPGGHDPAVVLGLFRVDEPEIGARYELRYLLVDDEGASDLYWFPWRLQVEATVAEVLDVAPIPVWSPDGRALAWIEWNGDGSTLRVVGWHDSGLSSNPSDEAASYRLQDIAPGTQLETWPDGTPAVLTARTPGGAAVEIEMALGGGRRA